MLAYLSGKIVTINPAQVTIDINGVGYDCQISLHTFSRIQDKERVQLFTHLHFKNEGQNLSALEIYGFAEMEERQLFQLLIWQS
jgi:Holliday junction DNA helicase RuvA